MTASARPLVLLVLISTKFQALQGMLPLSSAPKRDESMPVSYD